MRTKMIHSSTMLVLLLLAASAIAAWGQQCPDWSPYFNQIDDSAALQQLQSERSQGWPNFHSESSLPQSIAQGEHLIQQLQQDTQQDQRSWMQVRSSNTPMPNVSAAQCGRNMGAAMAIACDARIKRNELLGIEGMNDLMRCRAGMAAGSYSNSGAPSTGITSGLGPAWDSGVASVAGLNLSKRAGMVKSAVKDWQSPVEQQVSRDSLTQTAALSDPFVDSPTKEAGSSAPNHSPGATTDASSSPSEWSDPVSDSSQGNSDGSSTDETSAPSQPEIARALDAGIANSNEVSPTPVATVPDASNWDRFANSTLNAGVSNTPEASATPVTAVADTGSWNQSSSDPSDTHQAQSPEANQPTRDAFDDEIDRRVDAVNDLKDTLKEVLPHNEVSDELTDEGIAVVQGVAHQENHILNDAESAMHDSLFGDAPPDGTLNSDVDRLVPTMFESLPAYREAEKIRNEALDIQKFVTRTIDKVSCMFSFDPYCK